MEAIGRGFIRPRPLVRDMGNHYPQQIAQFSHGIRGILGDVYAGIQVEGFAGNSCFFWTQNTSEAYKGFRKGRRWDMLNSDVEIIRSKVPELQHLSPMLFGGSNDKNVVRGEKGGSYQVKGCYPEYDLIEKSKIISGRFINDIDIAENRKVCIIGERIYEVLFQTGEDAIGKLVKVNGIYFQVIGVAQKMSNASIGGSTDESVILPFSTMQKAFNQGNVIHFLGATSRPGVKVKVVEDKIKETLRSVHQISPDDKEAIGSVNIEDQFTMFNNLFIGIHALIWIVGLGRTDKRDRHSSGIGCNAVKHYRASADGKYSTYRPGRDRRNRAGGRTVVRNWGCTKSGRSVFQRSSDRIRHGSRLANDIAGHRHFCRIYPCPARDDDQTH